MKIFAFEAFFYVNVLWGLKPKLFSTNQLVSVLFLDGLEQIHSLGNYTYLSDVFSRGMGTCILDTGYIALKGNIHNFLLNLSFVFSVRVSFPEVTVATSF